jgi:sulfur transfer protein SufE
MAADALSAITIDAPGAAKVQGCASQAWWLSTRRSNGLPSMVERIRAESRAAPAAAT